MSNLQQYFNSNVFFFKLHSLRCNTLNCKGDMTRGNGSVLCWSHYLVPLLPFTKCRCWVKQISSGNTNHNKALMSFEGTAIKNSKKLAKFCSRFNPLPSLPSAESDPRKNVSMPYLSPQKQNWAIIISSYLLHLLDYNIIHTSLDVNGVMRTPKRHVINPSVFFLVACFNKTKPCL